MLGELFLEERGWGVCLAAKLAWNPQSSCLSLNNELSRGALMAELKDGAILLPLPPACWTTACTTTLDAGFGGLVWCCIYVQPSAHGGTG